MATTESQGFSWRDRLLVKTEVDELSNKNSIVAVPTKLRPQIMSLAHEKSGHFAAKKVKQLTRRKFMWPMMCSDIAKHYKSCSVCQ